jgi:hypothetical protein
LGQVDEEAGGVSPADRGGPGLRGHDGGVPVAVVGGGGEGAVAAGDAAQCGLGVTLKRNAAGFYYVKRVERGGPAEQSGAVEPMDTVIAVNGQAVAGLEYASLAALVLGPEGSLVSLSMLSHTTNAPKEARLRRFPIDPRVLEVTPPPPSRPP